MEGPSPLACTARHLPLAAGTRPVTMAQGVSQGRHFSWREGHLPDGLGGNDLHEGCRALPFIPALHPGGGGGTHRDLQTKEGVATSSSSLLLFLFPPRDPGTADSPMETSYREISSKEPNKYLRRVHISISPSPRILSPGVEAVQTSHSSATAHGTVQGVLAPGLFQAQSKSKTKRNRASLAAGKWG